MQYIEIIKWILIIFLIIIIFLKEKYIKKLDARLKKMEDTKDTLYYVGEEISKAENKQGAYSLILDAAIKLIPRACKGSILMLEEDGFFHFKSLKGYSLDLLNMKLNPEEIFLYKMNNFRETAIIENPKKFDQEKLEKCKVQFLEELDVLNISCTLSSPIYIDGILKGLINVDSIEKNKIFTREDVNIMNYIKNELQLALKNFIITDKLRYKANYDELTGLYNRRYFKIRFSGELEMIKRYKNSCCLALIDLDDFKKINDTFGHNAGDKVLKFFSDILRENIRETDVYARMSGDEFIILFINCSEENARKKMEEFRENVNNESYDNIKIDFSYGLCMIDSQNNLTSDEIFGIADKAMYDNKKYKKNRL